MKKATAEFMKTARARFAQAEEADKEQRQRELADLRFYAGEQWDSDILESRAGTTIGSGTTEQVVPARPSLVINKCREPVRQILNQERQSDFGIELVPADDFGEMAGPIDHTEIELREGITRRIQRDSEAADARTWAFGRSTIAGRGWYGVMTRYVPGKTSDQEVYVHRFYNQASVSVDPTHEQPDASDIDWGFVGSDVPWERYQQEHGTTSDGATNRMAQALSDDEWRQLGDEAPKWFTSVGDLRFVRVVEYWYTERTSRALAMFPDGRAEWVKALPPDTDKKSYQTRTVIEKQIKWCKIDGINLLDETDWPGHYIPLIKVLGEELQPYDKERRSEGVVRPMRGPCVGNNYIISKFVERVGLTPIPAWMMAGGQDEGYEEEYNAANTRTLSRLHYNQKDNYGVPAPPPFKPDSRADIADIGMGVQLFGQAIASTSLTPDTALGNADPTVKSGKLAKILMQAADRGNSNYLDNLMRSMRHEARIINDLLYPIYGRRPGRLARMMNPEGEMSAVLVGQPFTLQGQGKQARPLPIPQGQTPPEDAKTYTLTSDAEFNVAVKISKNFDTRREQEAETLGEIISADPQQMGVIGDLFFKYQDGPGHEEMSERYKAVLVPPVQALISGKPAMPPEAQAQMAQMQQQMQQLQQDADKNKTELLKADKDNATRVQIAQINQEGAFAVADLKATLEAANTAIAAMQAERLALESSHAAAAKQVHQATHEALQNEADRAHDVGMAAVQQAHASAMGAQGHQQAQQAAQPQPEAGA